MLPLRARRIFDRTEPMSRVLPIRHTGVGVWVPTPLVVIEQACAHLAQLRLLGPSAPGGSVIDAGTGDGRVAAVVADTDATRQIYGVEQDMTLCGRAAENMRRLEARGLVDTRRLQLLQGDYCDPRTYPSELDLRSVHLVFNYPDGNEARLTRFIQTHGGTDTRLCVLTHNRTLVIDGLKEEENANIEAEDGSAWRLSVYCSS